MPFPRDQEGGTTEEQNSCGIDAEGNGPTCSFLILMSASSTIGPQSSMSTGYVFMYGFWSCSSTRNGERGGGGITVSKRGMGPVVLGKVTKV